MKLRSTQGSLWNPFAPTARDIQRTEVLAKKNQFIAGALTLVFFPFAMIYLKRGVNTLKIFLYSVIVALVIGGVVGAGDYLTGDFVDPTSKSETRKKNENTNLVIGLVANIAMIAENIRSINLARQRLDAK